MVRAALCGYMAARKLADQNPTQEQIVDLAVELMDFPGSLAELHAEVHPDPRIETATMKEFRLMWEEDLQNDPKLLEPSNKGSEFSIFSIRSMALRHPVRV